MEPYASPIEKRIEALEELYENGLHTVVSLEPFLPNVPVEEIKDLIEAIRPWAHEFIFVGKLNDDSIPT